MQVTNNTREAICLPTTGGSGKFEDIPGGETKDIVDLDLGHAVVKGAVLAEAITVATAQPGRARSPKPE